MPSDPKKKEIEAYLDRGEAARLLKELARALRDGEVAIGAGDESLAVKVGDSVNFDLSFARHTRDVVRIEIVWRKKKPGQADGLVISD